MSEPTFPTRSSAQPVGSLLSRRGTPSAPHSADDVDGNLIIRSGDVFYSSRFPGIKYVADGALGSGTFGVVVNARVIYESYVSPSGTNSSAGSAPQRSSEQSESKPGSSSDNFSIAAENKGSSQSTIPVGAPPPEGSSVAIKVVRNHHAYRSQASMEINLLTYLARFATKNADSGSVSSSNVPDDNINNIPSENMGSGTPKDAASALQDFIRGGRKGQSPTNGANKVKNEPLNVAAAAFKHYTRLYDHFDHEKHLCIVFERLPATLLHVIESRGYFGLPLNLIREILAQQLLALHSLHVQGMLHCDVKPENVMISGMVKPHPTSANPNPELTPLSGHTLPNSDIQTDDLCVKLIDFGSAGYEQTSSFHYVQSRFYRAPEVLLGLRYDGAVDLWSTGCMAAELFLGLPLFASTSEYDLMHKIGGLLGWPPEWMLSHGSRRHRFFTEKVQLPDPFQSNNLVASSHAQALEFASAHGPRGYSLSVDSSSMAASVGSRVRSSAVSTRSHNLSTHVYNVNANESTLNGKQSIASSHASASTEADTMKSVESGSSDPSNSNQDGNSVHSSSSDPNSTRSVSSKSSRMEGSSSSSPEDKKESNREALNLQESASSNSFTSASPYPSSDSGSTTDQSNGRSNSSNSAPVPPPSSPSASSPSKSTAQPVPPPSSSPSPQATRQAAVRIRVKPKNQSSHSNFRFLTPTEYSQVNSHSHSSSGVAALGSAPASPAAAKYYYVADRLETLLITYDAKIGLLPNLNEANMASIEGKMRVLMDAALGLSGATAKSETNVCSSISASESSEQKSALLGKHAAFDLLTIPLSHDLNQNHALVLDRLSFANLVSGMLVIDPRKRLTAAQALSHPWFKIGQPGGASISPELLQKIQLEDAAVQAKRDATLYSNLNVHAEVVRGGLSSHAHISTPTQVPAHAHVQPPLPVHMQSHTHNISQNSGGNAVEIVGRPRGPSLSMGQHTYTTSSNPQVVHGQQFQNVGHTHLGSHTHAHGVNHMYSHPVGLSHQLQHSIQMHPHHGAHSLPRSPALSGGPASSHQIPLMGQYPAVNMIPQVQVQSPHQLQHILTMPPLPMSPASQPMQQQNQFQQTLQTGDSVPAFGLPLPALSRQRTRSYSSNNPLGMPSPLGPHGSGSANISVAHNGNVMSPLIGPAMGYPSMDNQDPSQYAFNMASMNANPAIGAGNGGSLARRNRTVTLSGPTPELALWASEGHPLTILSQQQQQYHHMMHQQISESGLPSFISAVPSSSAQMSSSGHFSTYSPHVRAYTQPINNLNGNTGANGSSPLPATPYRSRHNSNNNLNVMNATPNVNLNQSNSNGTMNDLPHLLLDGSTPSAVLSASRQDSFGSVGNGGAFPVLLQSSNIPSGGNVIDSVPNLNGALANPQSPTRLSRVYSFEQQQNLRATMNSNLNSPSSSSTGNGGVSGNANGSRNSPLPPHSPVVQFPEFESRKRSSGSFSNVNSLNNVNLALGISNNHLPMNMNVPMNLSMNHSQVSLNGQVMTGFSPYIGPSSTGIPTMTNSIGMENVPLSYGHDLSAFGSSPLSPYIHQPYTPSSLRRSGSSNAFEFDGNQSVNNSGLYARGGSFSLPSPRLPPLSSTIEEDDVTGYASEHVGNQSCAPARRLSGFGISSTNSNQNSALFPLNQHVNADYSMAATSTSSKDGVVIQQNSSEAK